MDENSIINKISTIGVFGNIVLVVFKFYAGIAGKSSAMVSDAIHSLSDVLATLISFVGVKISKKSADKKHPYGHERIECIASLFLGLILIGTGCGIGFNGVKTIISKTVDSLERPTAIALAASIVSIITKEAMFWYTRHYAKILNSSAFMADAWHHRSDALSSIGSLIGIGGSMLGYPILDPLACIIICICILKVGIDILIDAFKKLIDTSCDEKTESELKECILKNKDVKRIDMFNTRQFGNMIYIDMEISVDGTLTLNEAHKIAHTVHDDVEKTFPEVKHISIHENPF